MSKMHAGKQETKEDLTGKDRFAWNVVTSLGSYFFVLIPGFVMPRLIDGYQGSAALGLWDFCWAFVNYLRISGFGVGSSTSRYVAKHRAEKNVDAMRNAVSTVMSIQLIVAIFVLIVTVVLSHWLPIKFAESLGDLAGETGLVVIFLGGSLVLYFAFDSFRGVITGCHRWDVHNAIIAGTHGVNLACMILVLVAGGGLVALSATYFSIILLGELVRVYWAFKVCPDLKLGVGYVTWKRAKKMIRFGVKTSLVGFAPILVVQTTSVLVMGAMGAAVLAVFTRPVSLIRHVGTFVGKYSFVLIPMAGSIQADKDESELRSFMLEATRYGVSFTLPIVLFLAMFGDRILHYWMGADYAEWGLIAILAMGYFLPISQSPVMKILVGLNAHGRAAFWVLGVTAVTYIPAALYIESVGWSLTAAAWLVSIPMTASLGIAVPLYACFRLNISIGRFVREVFFAPVLCCAVYLALMVGARVGLEHRPDLAMLLGGFLGGLVLLPLYWVWIAPDSLKKKIAGKVKKVLGKSVK